jgi:hypothetical protein
MPICCEILCCNFDAGQTRLKRKSQERRSKGEKAKEEKNGGEEEKE